MPTAGTRKQRRRHVRATAAVAAAAIAAGGSAVAVSFANAEEPTASDLIVGADSPDAIEGSYIVVLEDDATSGLGALADDLGVDVEIENTLDSFGGYVAELSESEAIELAQDDSVAYVEQDQTAHVTEVQEDPPSWGLDRVDQQSLPLDESYEYTQTGAGVEAFILDTGLNADHTDFQGRVGEGYDFIDDDTDPDDGHGHGTHVAGTIGGTTYGLAKDVTIRAVRVLDDSGSGSYSGIISGIDWVAENATGPAVANMSLGGSYSEALNDAIAAATDAGVTFAVAAGNDGADACDYSPASESSAITVGATDSSDAQTSWSNYGDCVDILAPGASITSAGLGTDDSATMSGTSMASPHVAGVAALYLEADPDATPDEVATALTDGAVADTVSGTNGSPNLLLNTEFLS